MATAAGEARLMRRVVPALLLLVAVALSLAGYALNATQVEEFKRSKFYEIVSTLTSHVYRLGDVEVCPKGCTVMFEVRDLSAGMAMVYEIRGFHAVFRNVSITFAVEPVVDKLTDRVKATVINCYFNASRVEIDAPNITRIVQPGSHMFYAFKLPKPIVVDLGGYKLEIRGFAFIVTPEALRRNQVEKRGNNTIVLGFTTGIIPDAVVLVDDVQLPVGHVHEYPAVIYALYEAASGRLQPRTTVTAPGARSSSAEGGGNQLYYLLAAGGCAAAAAVAYAAWRRRR